MATDVKSGLVREGIWETEKIQRDELPNKTNFPQKPLEPHDSKAEMVSMNRKCPTPPPLRSRFPKSPKSCVSSTWCKLDSDTWVCVL